MLRFLISALVGLSFLLPGGAAAQRAAPHQSIESATLAGVDLCYNAFANVVDPSGPRMLNQLYEASGWHAIEAEPARFPFEDVGNNFGAADLAPGMSGRVLSALGSGAITGGARCDIVLLSAPGARDLLLQELESSSTWTELQIPNIPNTRMFGRRVGSPAADIGLTIMWGVTDADGHDLEAYLSFLLIPKSSITTGMFLPDGY
jgi:hypothetical protein